jgi:hypothetical protein
MSERDAGVRARHQLAREADLEVLLEAIAQVGRILLLERLAERLRLRVGHAVAVVVGPRGVIGALFGGRLLLVLLDEADAVERLLAFLGVLRRQVRVLVGLAPAVDRLEQPQHVLVRGHLLGHEHPVELDVGGDAHRLDRDVVGREVLRDGELQLGAVVVVEQHLHRALAVGLLADDHAAVEVLDRAGDDLGGRGRARVDQHRQRQVIGAGELGALLLALLAGVTDGGDQRAAVDEDVRDAHRLVEQTARVVAQVEDPALRALAPQLLHAAPHLRRHFLRELLQPQVADVAGEHARLDVGDADDVAHQIVRGVGVDAGARDGHRDLGLRVAAQPVHRLGQRQVDGRLVIDLDDVIARLEAGAGRRGVAGDQADHRQHVLVGLLVLAHADDDADAAELAAGGDVHLARASGSRSTLCGSSVCNMPLTAAYSICAGSDVSFMFAWMKRKISFSATPASTPSRRRRC